MSEIKVHQLLAQAFAAEGVDTAFTLMGDGNMYWASELAHKHGVRLVHARHEHAAVAMADGWARKTGKVGIASTTCGPGFTQIITALTVAVRRGTPLIVFVGDSPIGDAYHTQQIDQRPLAEATGARFIPLRSVDRVLEDVREAFYVARYERRPVVLSAPMDLQARTFDWLPEYTPSANLIPRPQRMAPDPGLIAEASEMIRSATHPIILAGDGAVRSGAGPALEKLGDQCGALLATTLKAKGLFDHSPWAIGISGAFAGDLAREYLAAADLVIAVGASLSAYTTEQGYMFPNAKVIQIDAEPRGLYQGLRVADLHIRADADAALAALNERLAKAGGARQGFRTSAIREAIAADKPDAKPFQIEPGTIDPRNALLELDKVIPPDWDVVVGVGHFFNFVATHMRGRAPERWFITHDFGAIGQGLPAAIGIAAARGDGKVILIEGDGSMLMHVQELEVMKRQGIRLLTCLLNDGAYSAEVHKLVPAGIDPGEAVFGYTDLATIARGFGLRGETVTTEGRLRQLFDEHLRAGESTVWDIQVSGKVVSQQYRRVFWGET